MKNEITNKSIQKTLLQNNGFGCSLVFSLLSVSLFVGLEIGAVHLLLDGVPQWWYMAIGGVIPLAMATLLIKLLGVEKAYQQRKNISNGQFYVVKDYCDSVTTHTYDSDGPTTKYIWHFLNTDSQIEIIEPSSDVVQKNITMCDYHLVFIQGEKQPTLFYNCKYYEYKYDA